MWSTTTGGATGASVPGSGDAVILDAATCVGGVTCTITVNTSFTILSLNMDACTATTTGCILDFATNNNSPTFSATAGVSLQGTGTRTVNMGSGMWTLSSASATWAVTASLTLNQGTSTILFSNVAPIARTFTSGGKTYNSVTIAAPTVPAPAIFTFAGAATFSTLTIGGGIFPNFPSATTTTITTLNTSGTSTAPVLMFSSSTSTAATLSVTSATMTWNVVKSMTFSGSAVSATNSLDAGGNTGTITITPPSTGGGGGGHIIGG